MNGMKFQNDGKVLARGLFTESKNPVFKKGGSIDCQEIIETYTFTSKKSYTPEECLNYSIRDGDIIWNDGDIVENKNNGWNVNSIICLVIKCSSNNSYYVSYQKVVDRNKLRPLKLYNIQSNNKKFISLSRSGILYCNSVEEGVNL